MKNLTTLFISTFFLTTLGFGTIINVPGDYSTIQAGIDASSDGDTVLVAVGTYVENINFNGKNIVVQGEDRETTIIDGNQNGSVVTFNSGESSTAALTGFTIQNGFAQGSSWPNFCGGGILCYNNSVPSLTNLMITGNSATEGSGIYCYQSSPSLVNVTISGNSAETDGGGIWCYDFSSSLVNVTISGNTASDEGGGIYCYGSNPSLVNVTISGNTAASNGGGIYCRESSPSLVNCILWNDSPQEIYIQSGSATATYSDVQGGWTGTGNIDADPLFVDAVNGDYHLTSSSPCIDAGDPNSEYDPDGTVADMGAYYYDQSTPPDDGLVWYVATTGTDSTGDGSEENPFATIQHGVESSSDGDTVLVAAGTYVENINFNGKNIVVTSMEGSEETTIHGNENEERVVTFSGGEDSSAVLNGFTVTNGYGGIWCSGNSSPVISNNVIKENVGVNGGGISINARTENGENNPFVVDNMIINNYAFGIGWSGKGGGVYCGQNSEAVFKNNVIANNYAGGQSGGIEFWMSEVNLINNTIVNNISDGDYGGIYMHYPTYADVVNTIVRGNSPGTQVVINCSWGGGDHTVISYSNIEGGEDGVYQYGPDCELVWGDGNIDAAPNFCSSYTGNYHLAEDSPCLGSGFDGANMGALGVGCENAVYAVPIILDIVDVPDDQGGRVYLEFVASMFDHQDQTNQSYTVFRYDVMEDTSAWVVVGSGGAIGDASYIYEVATLRDSTADDDGMTEFKVVASMNEGNFHSEPAMGYSVDNIAPSVPTGLIATAMEEGIYLTWDLSSEDDFQYFTLEKSLDADFTEIESFETIDTSFMDMEYEMNQTYFYRIVAVDHAGNISDYSETVEGAVLSIDSIQIPEVFALHQNYPNPFNPMTRISYDLPEDANVSISIYDVMGRVVNTMVNTTQEAGYKSVIWNATNDYGKPVSAGVYLYQIQAGEFRQTRRMVLLK